MPGQEAKGIAGRGKVSLRELLARAADRDWGCVDAPADLVITQVTDDSRTVGPGACFVPVCGAQHDGARYVGDAVMRGAVAVVTDRPISVPGPAIRIRVPDARRALARLAAVFTGFADANWARRGGEGNASLFRVIGVTGTNGKSTVCFMAHAILRAAGAPTALLGTIQYDLVSRRLEAPMTTPPAIQLMSHLAEAVSAGATHAVMEVSSHALDQRRADGIRFDAGVFTNLTGDHLDYHKDFEAYRLAKRRLFDLLDRDATAVINVDDRNGESMVEACRGKVVRVGLNGGADVYARIRSITANGTDFDLMAEGRSMPVHLQLVGRHNVQNALAAAAAVRYLGGGGADWPEIVAGLESVKLVRGRLERVGNGELPFTVLVDYAHTDDALQNVLSALRPLASGNLIVMFGCGGDRDRSKRPRMANVAERWADRIVVTSDNPRSERPDDIIEEILRGFSERARSKVIVQADRRRAIEEAIGCAGPGDVVLLAGKGHETYQQIGGQRIHFDDVEVATEVINRLCRGSTTAASAGAKQG